MVLGGVRRKTGSGNSQYTLYAIVKEFLKVLCVCKCCGPEATPQAWPLILRTALLHRLYFHLYLTDKGIETPRGYVTCLTSLTQQAGGKPGCNLRWLDFSL